MKRRTFLKSISMAAAAGVVKPEFLFAQGVSSGPIKNFVHIFLYGGACGRFMFPYLQGEVGELLRSYRPSAVPQLNDILQLSNMNQNGRSNIVGIHPYFSELVNALEETGAGMTIFTEYGVTARNSLSHEEATSHFQIGAPKLASVVQQGWLSRLVDTAGMPAMSVWGISESSPLMFNSIKNRPLVVSSLGAFKMVHRNFGSTFRGSDVARDEVLQQKIAEELFNVEHPEIPFDENYSSAISGVYPSLKMVSDINQVADLPAADFLGAGISTNSFQTAMTDITKVIMYSNSAQANPELRNSAKILCTGLGGWDAHININSSYSGRMRILAGGLKGLIKHLKQANLLDSTIVQVHTEFGRTNKQNSSEGLDHAAANLTFVLGGKVKRAVIGPDPSAEQFVNSNVLTPKIAFTGVLKEILSYAGFSSSHLDEVFKEKLPGEDRLNFLA